MDSIIETMNAETEPHVSRLFSPDSSVDFVGKAFGGEGISLFPFLFYSLLCFLGREGRERVMICHN